jgi:3-oxo-5-alpha-steroid 4-dehydrogenase 1
MHVLVAALALCFQLFNAACLGSWLAGYGPTTAEEWGSTARFTIGIAIFYLGLAGNFYHDEELREIRRTEERRQERIRKQGGAKDGEGVGKHYRIPEAGLFRYMLYPHYFCEWIEWGGFWIAAGLGSVPARAFFINEVTTMFPRAVNGKRWYIEKFGEEKITKKWAVFPGIY